jgi:hypothetical protein
MKSFSDPVSDCGNANSMGVGIPFKLIGGGR